MGWLATPVEPRGGFGKPMAPGGGSVTTPWGNKKKKKKLKYFWVWP
jgi:hypothetical protein